MITFHYLYYQKAGGKLEKNMYFQRMDPTGTRLRWKAVLLWGYSAEIHAMKINTVQICVTHLKVVHWLSFVQINRVRSESLSVLPH